MVHDVGVWLFARTDSVVLMLRVQVSSENISQHSPFVTFCFLYVIYIFVSFYSYGCLHENGHVSFTIVSVLEMVRYMPV
jgi:hypothetical protein